MVELDIWTEMYLWDIYLQVEYLEFYTWKFLSKNTKPDKAIAVLDMQCKIKVNLLLF